MMVPDASPEKGIFLFLIKTRNKYVHCFVNGIKSGALIVITYIGVKYFTQSYSNIFDTIALK